MELRLENNSLRNFSSSSFAIRLNLLHPESSLVKFGYFAFGFFCLKKQSFKVFFTLKVILHFAKMTHNVVTYLL